MYNTRNNKAFTLIELLVVIAIIAILAAILFPVFVTAKENAKLASCTSNMNQVGKALAMYLDNYNGVYPAAEIWPSGTIYNGVCKMWGATLNPYVKNYKIWTMSIISSDQGLLWLFFL